jgi:hypothetical protein
VEALSPANPFLAPAVVVTPTPMPASRRRRRVVVAPPVSLRTWLRSRLTRLALLGIVVLCQPWWWDVGDLRPLSPAIAAAHR